MPKLGTAMSETHTRPHFASHTQSSLMKRRTPMKKKPSSMASSSTRDANGSKRSQRNTTLRLNGVHKRQNNITKQSRSMQMLIMILKQQRDRRATVFLSGNELTGTTCQLENSFVSLGSDLIRDVSHDLKKCVGSPAKLAILHGKPIKVDESEKRAEDVHAFPQDETNCAGRENSKDTYDSSEDRAIVDVACKLQLRLSDGKKPADLCHRMIESREKPDNFPNKDCLEIEIQVQPQGVSPNVNAATNRKRTRKLWNKKVEARNEYVDHAGRTDLHVSKNMRFTKYVDNPQGNWPANDRSVVNSDVTTRKRGALQKNFASNQRAWRPPGVPKTCVTESATSLTQPISQKSSQSTEKSTTSTKSKHSSIEHVDESASTSISANQSKMLMKENRDPRANRMTKICEHLAETKQQQRLQSGGTLPKKRWWRTKIGPKVLDKRDYANPTLLKSKLRNCQTQPITPIKPLNNPNNVEQHHNESTLIYSKRSRTLEVIHTLKEIIDNVKDGDAEENAVKNDDHEKNYSEIQTSPNCDTSQNNELHVFTKDLNLDGADRSFNRSRKSVNTQTELDFFSYYKIDAEKDQDLKETLKLTRIVATQTSPSCNKNVVEVGCNTTPYNVVCKDVEVSCDLIGTTNSEIEVDSTTIKDKSTSDVSIRTTEPLSAKHIEIDVESEDTNENNKELPLSECKKTLNTKMNLKLGNCDSVEIPAKTTNDAAREAEKIIHEEACQVSLKSHDDKTNADIDKQESTKCSNNHGANNSSVNKLFLERSRQPIFDWSCSSEEITEYLENDVQYEDMATSELKVKSVPSGVIAAFELAAERARNLLEAVIIYHENLKSKESDKRNEETKVEDYETPKFGDDRHCLKKCASFISHENEDKIKSEFEAICHFANNGKDFSDFSTCSSRTSSFDEICEFELSRSIADQLNFSILDRQEECALLPRNEQARSNLNERSDLEDMKSLMQLVNRTQEEYALELLQSERNDESFETGGMKSDKTLASYAAIKETFLISRENLLPLIYCVVCTVVFWCLQFLFRCDSTK